MTPKRRPAATGERPTTPGKMIHLPYQYSPYGVGGQVLGKLVSVDGVDDARFNARDVVEIVSLGASGNQFDGSVAVIVRLADGRFAAFDQGYASDAGNDFSCGTGVVFLARTAEILPPQLSPHGQLLLARGTR